MTTREYILIRHEFSEANDRRNIGTPAFAGKDAPLAPLGLIGATLLREELETHWGIDPTDVDVAVSELRRTGETAERIGVDPRRISKYAMLDEIDHGLPGMVLKEKLKQGEIIPEASRRARDVLNSMPEQRVIISHGYLIAAIWDLAEMPEQKYFIPRHGEVRRLLLKKDEY